MTAADYAAKYFELLVACEQVIAANRKRANALINDRIVRVDYEASMGQALDNLTRTVERVTK